MRLMDKLFIYICILLQSNIIRINSLTLKEIVFLFMEEYYIFVICVYHFWKQKLQLFGSVIYDLF